MIFHKLRVLPRLQNLFPGNEVQVQFIAVRAEIGHFRPRLQVGDASHLVIWHSGYMAAHTADRISVGSTVLDHHALRGVRIIAGPGLGRIVQKACIKASATARAGLEEYIGEFADQLLIKCINPEDVPVEHFPFPVRGKR